MTGRVLFVDDDADVREAIGQTLELAGFEVTACRAFIEATDHLSPGFGGVVVTDIRMPGRDGFAMLERVLRTDPDIPVIVLTGEGDIPMAVRAMTEGAYDFLEKPCPSQRLIDAVSRGMEKRRLVLENRRLALLRGAIGDTAEAAGEGLAARMDMVERILIEDALRQHRGRVAAVAEALRLPRKTLYDKIGRHGIDPGRFRED
jgi:DNA-binding NtrC family response regulator